MVNTRAIWYSVAAIWGLILMIFVVRNRKSIATFFTGRFYVGWAKNGARSISGRVANAASTIMHTERPPETAG